MRTRLDEIRDELIDCVTIALKDRLGDFSRGRDLDRITIADVSEVLDNCFPAMADAIVSSIDVDALFPIVRPEVHGGTVERQIEKIETELYEVDVELSSAAWAHRTGHALALEVADVVVASMTALRLISAELGTTPAQVLAAVHEKNAERGYYEQPAKLGGIR